MGDGGIRSYNIRRLFPDELTSSLQELCDSHAWVTSVSAIVHAWYLVNASGDAVAEDVLFGKQNSSGKLSPTFPKAEEDVSSYGDFHSQNSRVCWFFM
jgi:hypothetical protein